MDGEGCIFIGRSRYQKKHEVSWFYNIRVKVTMTDRGAIDFLLRHFGGSLTKCALMPNQRNPRKTYRQTWTWELATAAVKPFLVAILPFLQVKQKQAEIGIAFRDTMNAPGQHKFRTPTSVATQEQYYQEMRALKRG